MIFSPAQIPIALAIQSDCSLIWTMPLPDRKPWREARLRIDAEHKDQGPDSKLVQLIADSSEARKLVLSSPDLNINHVAIKEGRCRKQLARLVRVGWLSPLIDETILAGTQPKAINRTLLLETELPSGWAA